LPGDELVPATPLVMDRTWWRSGWWSRDCASGCAKA